MTKYYWKGVVLRRHLPTNKYQKVLRMLYKFPKTPFEVAYNLALKEEKLPSLRTKHFVNGQPLIEFCKQNNICYVTALKAIKENRFKKFLKKRKIKL